MTIENRDAVKPGAKLYARYKGREYEALVVDTKEGRRIELPDGRQFKSLSAAGLAVNDGVACNGYAFWSLTKPAKDTGKSKATAKPKAGAKAAPKGKKAANGGKGKAAKKPKAARMATKGDAYGCGACSESFPTQKKAVAHALTHTTN